ncbi:MAG: zinc-ribbon domain-containing protein [Clostridia bacterium]|nr:zinc-ribbon domain-containing protein [Clostridia bacterium]
MFCKFCGNEVADDMKFCPKCGATVESTEIPSVDELFAEPYAANDEEKDSTSNKCLIFGILSLALNGLVGFILALVGLKQVNKYAAINGGIIDGKAKVGKILSTVAIPLSILSFIYGLVAFITSLVTVLNEYGLI